MAALKRRNRIVVFRLTEEEYDRLKTVCVDRSAGSISDFARSALLMSMGSEAAGGVDHRLAELEMTVRHISQLLERMANRCAEQAVGETK